MTAQLSFDGRVAIVTGAGSGLGRAHALLLAARGARVVVNDLGGSVAGAGSSEAAATAVVAQIRAAGGTAIANVDSVATEAGAHRLVDQALAEFGRVDIVVNNAGILRDKAYERMDRDTWQAVLDVHLGGAFGVTQAAWPAMLERGYGRVVSTTSASGLFGNDKQANYATAKMAIVGLTKALAVEGAAHGIRVNAVAPLAKTRMTDRSDRERVTGEERTTAADVMSGYFDELRPARVSPLVAWLAHEDCATTGEVYSVGGGRVARVFVAEAPGWFQRDHTPEDLRANWEQVNQTEGFAVPRFILDEFALYGRYLGAAGE